MIIEFTRNLKELSSIENFDIYEINIYYKYGMFLKSVQLGEPIGFEP